MVEIKVGRRLFRNPRSIKNEVRSFYKSLYHQLAIPDVDFDGSIVNRISEEEARALERMPTAMEVKNVVWDCDPSKAPSYDGFNLKFIKEFWEDIGSDFVNCVLNFVETGQLNKKINMTWVTLIPTVDDAKEVKDYRPISMVGCTYKVIAKVLANQIKGVMSGLVGETQIAFVD